MLLGDAYSRSAPLWSVGPDAIYRRFADALVREARVEPGDLLLDIGSGTGAVAKAVLKSDRSNALGLSTCTTNPARTSTRIITMDLSLEMLRCGPAVPSVVGDGLHLPFATGSFDLAMSAFVVSHVAHPESFLAESARVVHAGGRVLAMTFEGLPPHPAIAHVETVARQFGWDPPAWYGEQRRWASLTDTPARLESIAITAGLHDVVVHRLEVDIDALHGFDLVMWRLGHAHMADYVLEMPPAMSEQLVREALSAVGVGPHRLRRSLLMLSSTVPA